MGKSIMAQASSYEMGVRAKIKPSKTFSRAWAVRDAEKRLSKLTTFQISLYLIKKHSMGLTWFGFVLGWTLAGLLATR